MNRRPSTERQLIGPVRWGCVGRQESRAAYDKAIELAGNNAETASLTRSRNQQERQAWAVPYDRRGGEPC